jgi:hypothetical protein
LEFKLLFNHTGRLSQDSTFRLIDSGKIRDRGAAPVGYHALLLPEGQSAPGGQQQPGKAVVWARPTGYPGLRKEFGREKGA